MTTLPLITIENIPVNQRRRYQVLEGDHWQVQLLGTHLDTAQQLERFVEDWRYRAWMWATATGDPMLPPLLPAIESGDRLAISCEYPDCANPNHQVHIINRAQTRRPLCPHGHPYTVENTIYLTRKDGSTYYKCRTCFNTRQREWVARKRDFQKAYDAVTASMTAP